MSLALSPRSLRRGRRPWRLVTVLVVVAVLVVLVALGVAATVLIGAPGPSAHSTPVSAGRLAPARPPAGPGSDGRLTARHDGQASVGVADGVVPAGVSVLDDRYPAVTRLAPALLRALRAAARDAERDGVVLDVNSGWRSRRYQEQLFDEAVGSYGSAAAAARWVARPGTSVHEAGQAVDVGPRTADLWLARHGAAFGLCPVYANEPWHFELRPAAVDDGCPALYADPTRDPRMQR